MENVRYIKDAGNKIVIRYEDNYNIGYIFVYDRCSDGSIV